VLLFTCPNSSSLVLKLTAKQFSISSSWTRTHDPSSSPYKYEDPNIAPTKAAVAQWLKRLIIKRLANTSVVAKFSSLAPIWLGGPELLILQTQEKALEEVNLVGVTHGALPLRLVGSSWMDLRRCRFKSYSLQ
jgi:hypothetical protein